MFDRLIETNPNLALVMLEANPDSVPSRIRETLSNAGVNPGIYDMMRKDILRGNFSVIYLDSRLVGDEKARKKAQTQLERIRSSCVNQSKLRPLSAILCGNI